ncbi:MAG: hypothetical protein L6Q98_17785 [Anaerolineae bacterium]|nr:hypothetical protein [Anaerolineae bacterium]NUQ05941.1 hypothetical protein [Anaerolineae bacterium]
MATKPNFSAFMPGEIRAMLDDMAAASASMQGRMVSRNEVLWTLVVRAYWDFAIEQGETPLYLAAVARFESHCANTGLNADKEDFVDWWIKDAFARWGVRK